ncbi:putative calcium-transporting ATPase 13, plasma membrane-type protein [Tanacetum coccineum]
MGIQGTEAAREILDLVILNDDFASVVLALMWGRCVQNNIQKFIQFQLTANVVALVINFVKAASAGGTPLIPGQLLWIIILLIFHFKDKSIFNVDEKVKNTIILNTFVLCQVFNKFNSLQLEKRNVFEGIHKNYLFLGITVVTITLQVVMVELLSNFADTEALDSEQWGICIAIAALSLAIGLFVKMMPVPDTPMLSYIERWI